MQGRLLPPIDGRIQCFPSDRWREEFSLAAQAGMMCIEWIYEVGTESVNPLRTDEGIAEINRLSRESGTTVLSMCADYYMEDRLVKRGGEPNETAVRHLEWLIGRAGMLGIRYVVLPFVDASSLTSPAEVGGLRRVLEAVLPAADRADIELHLETDLRPATLADVLDEISHPAVRANYDTGNSASLGYDPREELMLLRPWLGSVHIKDRVKDGGTVPLGTGDADLVSCFRMVTAMNFAGPYILQVAREDGPSEVDLAVRNREFVARELDRAVSGAA
jgi:L-ribulose-5-phosphate 3-epimerase